MAINIPSTQDGTSALVDRPVFVGSRGIADLRGCLWRAALVLGDEGRAVVNRRWSCPVPAIFTSSEDRNPGCGSRVPADASSIRHRWLRVRWGADSDHSGWDGTGRNRWYRTGSRIRWRWSRDPHPPGPDSALRRAMQQRPAHAHLSPSLQQVHTVCTSEERCDSRIMPLEAGRGTGTRTQDLRIWNPLLYQLSYTPKPPRPNATPTWVKAPRPPARPQALALAPTQRAPIPLALNRPDLNRPELTRPELNPPASAWPCPDSPCT